MVKDTVATNRVRIDKLEEEMDERNIQNAKEHSELKTLANSTNDILRKGFGNGFKEQQARVKKFMDDAEKKDAELWSKRKKMGYQLLITMFTPLALAIGYMIVKTFGGE